MLGSQHDTHNATATGLKELCVWRSYHLRLIKRAVTLWSRSTGNVSSGSMAPNPTVWSQNPSRIPAPWVLVPLRLPCVSPAKVWQQLPAVASLWVAPWSPSGFSEFHFHPPCPHFPALNPFWFKYIVGFLFSRLLLTQVLDCFFSPLWPREARVTC